MLNIKSKVNLIIKSQEATISDKTLSTSLASQGILVKDFVSRFNEMSLKFFKGLLLNTRVYIFDNREFNIFINGIFTPELIKLLSYQNKNIFLDKFNLYILLKYLIKYDNSCM